MQKKIKNIFLVIFSFCLMFLFLGCSEKDIGTKNIETKKAGKIEVGLYTKEDIKNGKAELTPIVGVEKEDILDDGKGLYRITLTKEGEGTASLTKEKYEVGEIVTITAIPSENWKYRILLVDGVWQEDLSFAMPSKDIEVKVIFWDMSHEFVKADCINIEGGYNKIIEGNRYYFTINEELLESNYQYFNEDEIYCQALTWTDGSERPTYEVRKEGNGRYSFLAPEVGVELGVPLHYYTYILEVYAYFEDENNYDAIDINENMSLKLLMGGKEVSVNSPIKQNDLIINIENLNPLYEVNYITLDIYGSSSGKQAKKIDEYNYKIEKMEYGYIIIVLKKSEGIYQVICDEAENGAISASKDIANSGDEIVVTVTPKEGYRLASLKYKCESNEPVDIIEDNGAYCFIMPDGDTHIIATFESLNIVRGKIEIYNTTSTEYVDVKDVIIEAYTYINDVKTPIEINSASEISCTKGESFMLYLTIKQSYYCGAFIVNNVGVTYSVSGNIVTGDVVVPDSDFTITILVHN